MEGRQRELNDVDVRIRTGLKQLKGDGSKVTPDGKLRAWLTSLNTAWLSKIWMRLQQLDLQQDWSSPVARTRRHLGPPPITTLPPPPPPPPAPDHALLPDLARPASQVRSESERILRSAHPFGALSLAHEWTGLYTDQVIQDRFELAVSMLDIESESKRELSRSDGAGREASCKTHTNCSEVHLPAGGSKSNSKCATDPLSSR